MTKKSRQVVAADWACALAIWMKLEELLWFFFLSLSFEHVS
jgi:hypothetical protein